MPISAATGLNLNNLIELIEDVSQLSIGNTDTDDISQDLVVQYIKEGYQRIVSLDDRWPWLQSVWTFNTITDQRGYSNNFTLTNTSSTAITVPQVGQTLNDIREAINLVNNTNSGNELIYIDQFKAEQIWVGPSDNPGQPYYWSIWAGQINLWPKPDQVYAITMRGYREPSLNWLTQDSPASTSYVDLNQEFHLMLVNFVMMRIFQFQEDPEMAAVYQRHFQEGVAIAKDGITAPNSNQPMMLSSGLQTSGYYWWNSRPGIVTIGGQGSPVYGVAL
jgi:hypothetical protein